MRKHLLLVCLVLLCSISLVFANGSSESDGVKNMTTTFWTDSQQLEEGLVAAVNAFTTEHPEYTINVESFPGSERPEKLSLAKESNTLQRNASPSC